MRCWRALLFSAVLWSQAALAALSPEAFTQEYAAKLRAALPDRQVEILGPLELRVTGGKGSEYTSYLDNAYNEYLQDPDAREEILGRRVAAALEMSSELPPLARENIVPVVKDRDWLAETAAAVSKKGAERPPPHVVEDLNDVLVIVYAEDTPLNIRYFGPEDLKKAGIERARLRSLAVENLRRLLPKVELHDAGAFKMMTAGGNYEACLLLLDDLWDAKALGVTGEIVVAVPSRDLLLITSSDNDAGIARVREIVAEVVEESPYSLTGELFVYRKGGFVRF
jgi:uncharacterized protein YtpQ (UPF0354 family)